MTNVKELSKIYDPGATEEAVYQQWEQSGAFKPLSDGDATLTATTKPYAIIMPPPNATGRLHTGHAIMVAIEDALIRYHRMRGDDTLYLPGTDHAAIATSSVVDRQLADEGIDKHDLGKEEFAKRAKSFALDNKAYIEDQLRALGASADWNRNAFTMDQQREEAVKTAFHRLYENGLVYRGSYMVNWCPTCRTVLADDEVEHDEQEGVLYYMKYGPFELATTRPETKVGDTAVAVHPKDARYTKYIGKEITVKTINGDRQLRVVADEMVDPEFGTGVVKITPFHDRNDYEVSQRHHLEAIEVIGEDGKMTMAAGPELAGLDRFEARSKMVAWLKKNDLLVREELHHHSVGRCYRSDDVIEPRISMQWFLAVSKLKEAALEFVDSGALSFVPQRFEKTYRAWIDNLYDWCISRQVWFGHPLPAYLKGDEVSLEPKEGFVASTDTLDTWFSSALWPFSTMGWPDTEAHDLKRFFPGDVLETGYDIIPFWVSRMILMTIALDVRSSDADELKPPFHTTYLHGLVRDKRGRKFSKSLGNGVDPLELIGKYGADSLRFMLATSASPGNDLKFDEDRVVAARNFANKLWNIARFCIAQDLPGDSLESIDDAKLTAMDRGVLAGLTRVVEETTQHLDAHQLGLAGNGLYEFVWSDFADWYIEAAKVQLRNEDTAHVTKVVLRSVLETVLKLLHPFMPFVTETLWSNGLGHEKMLIVTPWPESKSDISATEYEVVKNIVDTIRSLRAEKGVEAAAWIQAHLVTENPEILLDSADVINALGRIKILKVSVEMPDTSEAVTAVSGEVTVVLPMAGLLDNAKETARLQKELERATMEVERLQGRLSNTQYVSNAPASVVKETKEKLAFVKEEQHAIKEQLARLEK
jgi:valyl-tRNA synthetase